MSGLPAGATKHDAKLFDTPPWCVTALMAHEHFTGSIVDPACGTGSIVKTIRAMGYDYRYPVTGSDLYDHGFGESGVDFLQMEKPGGSIITNPPYGGGLDTAFAIHGAKIRRGKVAMLLPLRFLAGGDRIARLHREHPFSTAWIFSERPTMYRPGAEVRGSGTIDYAWFVWDCSEPKQKVRFLSKGYRPGPKYARQMGMDAAIEIFKAKGGFA